MTEKNIITRLVKAELIGSEAGSRMVVAKIIIHFICASFLIVSVAGCASTIHPQKTSQPSIADRTLEIPEERLFKNHYGVTVVRHKPMEIINTGKGNNFTLTVTGPTNADIKVASYMTDGEVVGLILFSLIGSGATFGALALPLLAADATGLGVLFSSGTGIESYRASVLKEALTTRNFVELTEKALKRRLGVLVQQPNAPPAETELEVKILNYGLFPDDSGDACFIADIVILLKQPGCDVHKDWIIIEPRRRSDDAPPAFCTHAKRFYEDSGALARKTVTETAEIIASILARRIKNGAK